MANRRFEIVPSDKTVGCVGCFRRLQFGVVPKGLAFPSGSGVNVWCKTPEAGSYPSFIESGIESLAHTTTMKNMINLCVECFYAHMSGKRTFSFAVLGISIVTALYKEDTKYLKVEGPTKVVTLGGEPDSEFSSIVSESTSNNKRVLPLPITKRYPGRKILRPLTPPSDEEIAEVKIANKIKAEEAKERKRSSRMKKFDVSETNVGYMSVGGGTLGSVEMTDDCESYEHITIKQEPPDMSELCILPGAVDSEVYPQIPHESQLKASQIKVEVEDNGS